MESLTRRTFLKTSLAAGAALPLACTETRPAAAPPAGEGGLARRTFGKTGQRVTILGLGCAYVGTVDEADARQVVETALDCGIRYFDTAPNYKASEERLGRLLAGVRKDVFLVTKLDHIDAKGAEADLRRSLGKLRTDHVDLLLLHGVGLQGAWREVGKMLAKDGALAYARRAKRQGLTRFIGMSVHPPHRWALKLLDGADDLDLAMPFVNPLMAGEAGAADLLARCRRMGMALAAMKVLGGDGQLAADYDRTFRYALSVPGLSCAVIGAKKADEVRRAARAAREFRPLTPAERKEAVRAAGRGILADAPEYAQLRRHFARDLSAV